MRTLSWVCQLVAAVILGQTLFFKFTAAPESVYIFQTLGAEPWGRIGSGLVELVAVILLLSPTRSALGALLAAGVMSGAVLAHLTRLGIEVRGDRGVLFGMALTTLACSLIVLYVRRRDIPLIGNRF